MAWNQKEKRADGDSCRNHFFLGSYSGRGSRFFLSGMLSTTRTKIEIPAWVVGDYLNMDEMHDDFSDRNIKEPDAFITFQSKRKGMGKRY